MNSILRMQKMKARLCVYNSTRNKVKPDLASFQKQVVSKFWWLGLWLVEMWQKKNAEEVGMLIGFSHL